MIIGDYHAGCFQDLEIIQTNSTQGGWSEDMTGICVQICTSLPIKIRASCGLPQWLLPPFAGTCFSCSSIFITPSHRYRPRNSQARDSMHYILFHAWASIHRRVHFTSVSTGIVCCTAAIRIAAISLKKSV